MKIVWTTFLAAGFNDQFGCLSIVDLECHAESLAKSQDFSMHDSPLELSAGIFASRYVSPEPENGRRFFRRQKWRRGAEHARRRPPGACIPSTAKAPAAPARFCAIPARGRVQQVHPGPSTA